MAEPKTDEELIKEASKASKMSEVDAKQNLAAFDVFFKERMAQLPPPAVVQPGPTQVKPMLFTGWPAPEGPQTAKLTEATMKVSGITYTEPPPQVEVEPLQEGET